MVLDDIKQSLAVNQDFSSYLNDESGIVTDGMAERILFPQDISEFARIVTYSYENDIEITISGGGTGISGGRVPRKGWIIATDNIRSISSQNAEKWKDPETGISYQYKLDERNSEEARITVPISMTLKSLQNLCRELNWFYPVDPTERTSFVGGNVATNASGARTFKYGTTRDWTQHLKVILANGELLEFDREVDNHSISENSIVIKTHQGDLEIPRPTYSLPITDKNVAGPVITDNSNAMDLFIGTGGLFGIIAEPTFKLIRPPGDQISLFVYTKDREHAYDLIEFTQRQKQENKEPIPMSVEYLGPRAVEIIKQVDPQVPREAGSLLMIEQDATSEDEMMEYLGFWWKVFEDMGVLDTSVAQTHKEIEHHKFLRHKVPETVNATVRSYGQAKLGTDYSVPNKYFRELFEFAFDIGVEFEEYQKTRSSLGESFGYAVWGHAGNSHVHLNLLPRDDDEDKIAKSLIVKVLNKVISLDGSIAAEHGLGKKKFDGEPALLFQYGKEGMEQILAMKKAIDPKLILGPGNLLET